MESIRNKSLWKLGSIVSGGLAMVLATGQAFSLTGTWICDSGAWEDPACWSYSGVGSEYPDVTPEMMDEAQLLSSDDIDRVVTRSTPHDPTSYRNEYPDYMTIDATGSGTMTLVQTAGTSGGYTWGNFIVGDTGTGTLEQRGGVIYSSLTLGRQTGSSGTYRLIGGQIVSEYDLIVGDSGNGLVEQSGGVANFNLMRIGNQAGSTGTYTMTDGTLIMAYNAQADISWIGRAGNGTFNQSGGSHRAATGMVVGAQEGGQGTYNMSGGQAKADQFLTVGDEGTGIFSQTGGVVRITGDFYSDQYSRRGLTLGYSHQGQGTYNLIDGTLTSGGAYYSDGNGNVTPVTTPYINVDVGNAGTGVFNQSGGLLDLTVCLDPEACNYDSKHFPDADGAVNLAVQTGSIGTYNMTGGSAITNGVNVGIGGQGTFNQSGGSQIVKGTLAVADDTAGGSGVYTLSGGTLNAQNIVVNENGSFNYDGGSVTARQFTNGGTVALHNPAVDTLINGKYTQLATGILQLEGEWSLLDGLDYSRLDVRDTALLGGTLDFSLDFDLGGYTPDWSNGDPLGLSLLQFDLFSAESILGTFDLIELPDLGDLDPFYDWKVSYLLNDFDTDYLRLSMVYTGGTAVPEPSTLLMLIPGLAMMGFARRKTSTMRGSHHT